VVLFDDLLILKPEAGYMISGPLNGTEQGGLVVGNSMDDQMIRNLFRHVSSA
jgi:alpha-L-fucosidase 2